MKEDFNYIEAVRTGLNIAPFVITAALSYYYLKSPVLDQREKAGMTEAALVISSLFASRAERDLLEKSMNQKESKDYTLDEMKYWRYIQYMALKKMKPGEIWHSSIETPHRKTTKVDDNRYKITEVNHRGTETSVSSPRGNFNWLTDEVVEMMNQTDED